MMEKQKVYCSTLLRYFFPLLVILVLNHLIVYTSIADTKSQQQSSTPPASSQLSSPTSKGDQTSSTGTMSTKPEGKPDTIVNAYTIALGLLLLFSAYNTLAIYNKKEQYDREIGEIIKQHQAVVILSESNHKEVQIKFQEMKLEIDKLSLGIETKVNTIYKEIEKNTDEQIMKLQNECTSLVKELGNEQSKLIADIKRDFTQWRQDISSHIAVQENVFNRHLYSYTLYSLIPLFLTDKRNRNAVNSALYWYTQYGDVEDLEMLNERFDKIPSGDHDLRAVCSNTIRLVNERLSNNV